MIPKIAIIGGGPAGLKAALEAAKKGAEVTLWEAGKIGENINCAEGFFDPLKLLDPPGHGVRYQVNNIIVECERTYQIDTSQLHIWMLDRREWQQALAREALDRGVEIRENERIGQEDLEQLQADFDWVMDASGIPAISSLKYNFREIYRQQALITVQYQMQGDFSPWEKAFKAVLFEDLPGYGWIFPRDNGIANVGLGIFNLMETPLNGKRLYKRLDSFINEQDIDAEVLSRAAGICPNKRPEWLVRNNLLLLGDAAGLTSPLHGGGIDLACLSGQLAVEAVLNGDAAEYPRKLNEAITNRLELERELRRIWLEDYSLISRLVELIAEGKSVDKLVTNLFTNPADLIRYLPLLKRVSSVYLK